MKNNSLIEKIAFALVISTGIVFLFLVGKTGFNQMRVDKFLHDYNIGAIRDESNLDMITSQRFLYGRTKQTKGNIKQIACQHDAQVQADQLFNIMLTYDDSFQYNCRAKQAELFAETQVLSNPEFFGNDKQKDGSHLINAAKLHSKFENADVSIDMVHSNLVNVLIKTKSLYWKGTGQKSELTVLYAGTYNLQTNKFRNLVFVQQISNKTLFNNYT